MPRKIVPDPNGDDLFGHPLRPPVLCPGPCRRVAEPFVGEYCWSCATELKFAERCKRLPNGAGRKPRTAKVPAGISPVYTAVRSGGF